MIGLLKAVGAVKVGVAIATLTAVTAFAAANVSLPAGSDHGQAAASAAAANANGANAGDQGSAATVAARLEANKARLLDTLNDVLSKLQANPKVNANAIDALKQEIAAIQSGDLGLNQAAQSVTTRGSASHPTASDHPGR